MNIVKINGEAIDVISIHFDTWPPHAVAYQKDENGQFALKDGDLILQRIDVKTIEMNWSTHAD